MRIIGLNGGMGVGKSTAAGIITQLSDRPVHLVKFAQPLYDMQEYIYSRIKSVHTRPSTFIKDRKLLQWLGTEWGRGTISESLWIDLWRAEVEQALSTGCNVICDDVRFDNEGEIIRKLGGTVINIQSIHAENRMSNLRGITAHASEAGVNSNLISRYVRNDGTPEEFKVKLASILIEEGLGTAA